MLRQTAIVLTLLVALSNVVRAEDYSSIGVQTAIGILGGIIDEAARSQGSQQALQDKKQQDQESNKQNTNTSKTFTAQYGDFKWGMSIQEVKGLLAGKGKIARESQDGNGLISEDTIFGSPRTVWLTFTPKSKKLYAVAVGPFPTNAFSDPPSKAIIDSLTEKYGKYSGRNGTYFWGNDKTGDRITVSETGSMYEFNIVYSNSEVSMLAREEEQELLNEWEDKMRKEAASKL